MPASFLQWYVFSSWFFCRSHVDLRLQGSFIGPRTNWSNTSLRTEATGYGLVSSFSYLFSYLNMFVQAGLCTLACRCTGLLMNIAVQDEKIFVVYNIMYL